MNIEHVERFTIPLSGDLSELFGDKTTVAELITALKKLPAGGIVSHDYNGQNLYVTSYNEPIEA